MLLVALSATVTLQPAASISPASCNWKEHCATGTDDPGTNRAWPSCQHRIQGTKGCSGFPCVWHIHRTSLQAVFSLDSSVRERRFRKQQSWKNQVLKQVA